MTEIAAILSDAVVSLKHHAALPSLTQHILLFISNVLQQVNDNHAQSALYESVVPELLRVLSSLLSNRATQAAALDTLYDVIIQGDCLRGNWKPIVSSLKVRDVGGADGQKIATTENCGEGGCGVRF